MTAVKALRTADECFADLPDFPFRPHHVTDLPHYGVYVPHYLDIGPATGRSRSAGCRGRA